jgi:peptidyl-prolyl cis-trans isomerase D
MMRQMRQNTKIIMLVTATAFVALMVFEWGMDMSGQSSGGGDLGRVGRTSVSVFQWQETRRQLFDRIQRSQSEPITAVQSREIDDLAWDEVVNQILIQHELKRRGIRVTDDEIRQAARFAPPPDLQADPAFQTDGQFDLARYQAFLAQASADPLFLQQLEEYYRDIIPRSKLIRQVSAGIFVSDAQLWEDFRDTNERVDVRFVPLNVETIVADSEVQVSSAEIEARYREIRANLDVPASAEVIYSWVSLAATAADSVAALERAQAIRAELVAGASFSELARLESSDLASAREGGSLGTFTRGQMVTPFEEAAFSLPVDQISEPVQTDFGWHLIQVTARDEEAGTVQARHILFSYEPYGAREQEILSKADELEALGERSGLRAAAAQLGLEVRSGEITEVFAFLPEVGNAGEAQDWIFEEDQPVGAVSPVFETRDGFFMVEITGRQPARTLPLDEVRDVIEREIRAEKKRDIVLSRAGGLVRQLRDGSLDMEAMAESFGVEVQTPETFTRRDFVPGMGSANAAIGAAFGTAVGQIAEPVAVRNQVFVIEVLDREEASRELFDLLKSALRSQLTAQLRQERLELWLDGLRETTRIVDRRAEYFAAMERLSESSPFPIGF